MKKYAAILIGFIIPINSFSQSKQVFFDFNTFEEKIQEVYTNQENQLLSEDGEAIAEIGSELFMLDNWVVTLTNASSQNPFSQRDSYSKKVVSKEQGTVLGVRVHFPEWPYSGEAFIRPKFPILPFKRTGEYANINNGVITNVGSIKKFAMWVNGRNFPFTIGVRVRDIKGTLSEFSLGSLFYVGWRKLTYNNSAFSTRIINNILPNIRIYPSEIPLIRFDNFVIYRPGNVNGGDFVTYLGSSDIEFMPYITKMPEDIDDENTWGIINAKQKALARALNDTLYEEILQYEYAKQRVEMADKNNATQDNQAENTQEQ